MNKLKKKIVWIVSLFVLIQCTEKNKNLIFWEDKPNYEWKEYEVNQSLEQNEFQFHPFSLMVHAKAWEYPFMDWILPYYEVYKPSLSIQKNAIKWGACLADISYLSIHQKNLWLKEYKNYSDSLKQIVFEGYELPEFYNTYSLSPDSLHIWVSAQLGALNLITKTLEKKSSLKLWVYFGAWLETLYILSHNASMKEDVSLFLLLEEHKQYVEFYQQFLYKETLSDVILQDIDWIKNHLSVTQTVNVWDSVENQFYLKTFPLKEPVLNLHKTLTELRKKWILET